MSRPPADITYPPVCMRAETAAAYVDEVSVESFRRRVGDVYPRPVNVKGRGEIWLKSELDEALAATANRTNLVRNAEAVP